MLTFYKPTTLISVQFTLEIDEELTAEQAFKKVQEIIAYATKLGPAPKDLNVSIRPGTRVEALGATLPYFNNQADK